MVDELAYNVMEELQKLGVSIFKGKHVGGVEIEALNEQEFVRFVQASGVKVVFHQDLSDLQNNTGAERIDREKYVASYNGITVVCYARGE